MLCSLTACVLLGINNTSLSCFLLLGAFSSGGNIGRHSTFCYEDDVWNWVYTSQHGNTLGHKFSDFSHLSYASHNMPTWDTSQFPLLIITLSLVQVQIVRFVLLNFRSLISRKQSGAIPTLFNFSLNFC